MAENGASDLYLTVGSRPIMRVDQDMVPVSDDILTPVNIQTLLGAVLKPEQMGEYQEKLELNTAIDLGEKGRFRINVLQQKQFPAMVIRRILTKVPDIDTLRLSPVLKNLAMERRGLVLLVGMTGSGKSTTLASMIDHRNRHEGGHIITIEDPIEYYHTHQKGIITQREVGVDTHSYHDALKSALRQRPDVILIGEIRDRAVMEQALACAETGHLCLATVHANNAYQAIERIINFFPEEHVSQVRMSLAENLKGIVSQRLLKSEKGGMVPVLEIMLNQGLIRESIAKGEMSKISDVMEKNTALGMKTFDQSLIALYTSGDLSAEAVIKYADRSEEMKVKLNSIAIEARKAGGFDNGFDLHKQDGGVFGGVDTSSLRLKD